MEYNTLAQVVGLLILVSSVLALDAHSGTGAILARDTDKVSALRNKLARLSNLLSLLDNGDENDLQKVAVQKKTQLPPKTPLVSEDMGIDDSSQDAPVLPPKPQRPTASTQDTKPLVPADSSIQVLAKALARLKEPSYNTGDSTGDHLGSDHNESGSDDQRTLDMEQMLERALARLDQDKMKDANSKKSSGGERSGLDKTPDSRGIQAKGQGLKVIESRLMQDILFANELGISVDDLIRDLDTRASKEVNK